jgi:hypothetical protein
MDTGSRVIGGALIAAVALSVGAVGGTLAQDADCELSLRDAPIETVAVPEGWEWDSLEWLALGLWNGSLSLADEDSYGYSSFLISCAPDAAGTFARQDAVREALGLVSKITVVPVGDETVAYRSEERPVIAWRHGDIIATLSISEEAEYGDFEAFANAIDALLP